MSFSGVWEGIKNFFIRLGELIVRCVVYVLEKVISFTKYVVNWLKSLNLQKGKHVPIVINKEMIARAPEVKIPDLFADDKEGIVVAVFDNDSEQITDMHIPVGEELDEMGEQITQKAKYAPDGIVVLGS